MKTPTELDIIKAYNSLSICYSQLYLLVKIEDIFYNNSDILEFSEGTWEDKFIRKDNKSFIELEFSNLYYECSVACSFLDRLFLKFSEHSSITRDNIQDCKDIVLKEIKQYKEILKGF